MKKKNVKDDFDEFYEDEESLKMMDILRENAKEKISYQVKKSILYYSQIAFCIMSIILIIFTIWYGSASLKQNKNTKIINCIRQGNNYTYCEKVIENGK